MACRYLLLLLPVATLTIGHSKSPENPKPTDNLAVLKGRLLEKEEQIVKKDDLIVKLVQNCTSLQKDVEQQAYIIDQILPFLSIRDKIEYIEKMYIPEKLKGTKLRNPQDQLQFHTQICHALFQKVNVSSVVRLRQLLHQENLSENDFCSSYGGFFAVSIGSIHIPRRVSYTDQQLVEALTSNNMIDPVVIKTALVIKRM